MKMGKRNRYFNEKITVINAIKESLQSHVEYFDDKGAFDFVIDSLEEAIDGIQKSNKRFVYCVNTNYENIYVRDSNDEYTIVTYYYGSGSPYDQYQALMKAKKDCDELNDVD